MAAFQQARHTPARGEAPGNVQLRVIGELSNEHGRGAGELTTRQTVQLHYLELGSLPVVRLAGTARTLRM